MPHWELFIFFLVISFIYASVGFGGGSSYLAILSLYAMPFPQMKLTALICNIIVVTGGVLIFIKRGEVRWRRVLPLIALSVPMSFLGARMRLHHTVFFILLGSSLLAAGLLLLLQDMRKPNAAAPTVAGNPHPAKDMLPGMGIGFLSGMVGIGGGIFLAPLLHLTRWDTARHIAATASLFILANSIAGIAGQLSAIPTGINFAQVGLLALAVLIGGQAGSRMGAIKFPLVLIRRLTAGLVLVAGTELLLKHLLKS